MRHSNSLEKISPVIFFVGLKRRIYSCGSSKRPETEERLTHKVQELPVIIKLDFYNESVV